MCAQGRKGTGPYGDPEKFKNIKQVPIRLHKNDWVLIKQWLGKEGLAFQHFATAMVEAYLQRDQYVVKLVEDWKKANILRWKGLEPERFDFSSREKRALLDELSTEFDDLGDENKADDD